MTEFRKIEPGDITDNIFRLIGTDWMLITAGNINEYNTMTASWGGMGFLWNRNICSIFVRPQRYTYRFTEKYSDFTLSFFTGEYREALKFCGSKSGRDYNKAAETGLSLFETEKGNVSFKEARLIVECRKIYYQDIDPGNFIDASLMDNYSQNDYHRMYTGEITGVYTR